MSMTKEEAIKFLGRYVGNEHYTPQCQQAHRMAIEALREERRWIAVTERLPDEAPNSEGGSSSELVLVVVDGQEGEDDE